MQGAPFVRLIDKISFIIGVFLLIFTTFVLGRFPHNYAFLFYVIVVLVLVIIRTFYYKSKGWHYYLFDFCYFANAIMMIFILKYPKNEMMFKVAYNYS